MTIMPLAALACDKAPLGSEILLTSDIAGDLLVANPDRTNEASTRFLAGNLRPCSDRNAPEPDGFPIAL